MVVPFFSACGFGGGGSKVAKITSHAEVGAGGAGLGCWGHTCRQSLVGTEIEYYAQYGNVFGFGGSHEGRGCAGGGGVAGEGVGAGALFCKTWIGSPL